ncbi:hypothetical protein O181_056477 [Austropuccinia psidii MF-1]|uniref:Uncharacterized protein n=1 Tax=Austropuccinia psidii MF-1 TaxID=1389203 RepID=A0A9Q3HUH0_9BASI|nr:hypothetical protein [Austropuccinia psidii MF-1]
MDTNKIFIYFRFCALCVLSRVSPAFAPPQQPMLVMPADKHTRNACLLSNPSKHAARGVPDQDSFVVNNNESIPEREWTLGPQTGRQEQFRMIIPVPSGIDLSTPPLLGHHPMVTSLLDQSKVIIRLMKDGNGKRRFELGPIVTMSCHPMY